MSKSLIWVHEDALREDHAAYQDMDLCSHGFFVWDETYLRKTNYGMKRLIFIYETLCELGIPIYRGDTEEVAITLMQEHQAEQLLIANTHNPELLHIIKNLSNSINLRVTDEDAFVSLEREPKLKRFFGYWKKAKPVLLRQ